MKNYALLLVSDKPDVLSFLSEFKDVHFIPVIKKQYEYLYRDFEQVIIIPSFEEIALSLACIEQFVDEYIDGRVVAVIPTTEKSVLLAAHLSQHYSVRGNSVESATLFVDKYEMRTRAMSENIRCPAARLTSREALTRKEYPVFPFVLKKTKGSGSQGVALIHCEQDIDQALIKFGPPTKHERLLTETAIDIVEEYHSDAVIENGEIIFQANSEYIQPILKSPDAFRASINLRDQFRNHQLNELLPSVVAAFGAQNGILHMETLYDGKQLHFGEIALRPGGGGIADLVEELHGVNLWRELLRLSFNLPHMICHKNPISERHVAVALIRSTQKTKPDEQSADRLMAQENILQIKTFHDQEGNIHHSSPMNSYAQVLFEIPSKIDVKELVRNYVDIYLNNTAAQGISTPQ
ncbi:hypothetical protein SBX64_06250 [Vibrio rhizosphaerae]|uniref:ATP-grasp domain-containing protein n=1 Tax=Vibrio rhizosphaerae TaxID=398736 RepID=A0ABU4ISM8_9VIBR|nr:hypothetical protein [Vibrio rhizosphaerae]MDW6092143.1 hypothetical protein [Vibrio rhizosphaerae]